MTLKELSDKLNVSQSTISRVLNDKPGIKAETRAKVLEGIKKENYSTNYAAKNLASSTSRIIGIIGRNRGSEEDSIFFHHSLNQFMEITNQNNFLFVAIPYNGARINFENSPLSVDDYAGFIVRGQSIPTKDIISLQQYNKPIVLLENALEQTEIDYVISNDYELEKQLVQILVDGGYKRIVHITGPSSWYNNRERTRGYSDVMKENNMKEEIIHLEDTTTNFGIQVFDQLKIDPKEKTGISLSNDALAIGFMKAAGEHDLQIPNQLGIVGFDDIPWAQYTTPPLTTANTHISEMGIVAAQRLINKIDQKVKFHTSIVMSGEIKKRKTTL